MTETQPPGAETLRDLLDELKDRDAQNVGVVSLLTARPFYINLCASWPNAARNVTINLDEPLPVLPPNVRTRWLWACVEPSAEVAWADAAGQPVAPHVVKAMHVLQENGAVFPDGTLSQWVFRFLAKRAQNVGAFTSADAEPEAPAPQ